MNLRKPAALLIAVAALLMLLCSCYVSVRMARP